MDPLRKSPQPQRDGPELVRGDASGGGLIPERKIGLAYIPRPELSGGGRENVAPRSRFPLVLVALAVVVGIGSFYLGAHFSAATPAPSPAAAARTIEDNRIIAGAPDLDVDATAIAREQLAKGDIPAELKGASEQTLRDLREGRTSLYKVFVHAPGAPTGAIALASIGGAGQQAIPLSSGGMIHVPLAQGIVQNLKLTVDASEPVSLHAKTSTGKEVVSTLNAGDGVQWEVVLP